MEARQMAPFFSSTFSALTVCNIHLCIWKWSKFIFNLLFSPPPLVYSGLQNTSVFRKSYGFRQPIILFLKVDTLRLIKIHIISCPSKGGKKKLSAHGLILVVHESKCIEIQKFCSSAKSWKFLPLKQSQKKSEYMKFTYFADERFF